MQTLWDTLWLSHKSPDIHPQILSLVKKYSRGKKVLEIGFGTGGDLQELQKMGFACFGIETSKIATKRGQKLFGKERIVFGNGEAMPFPDGMFHAIFHQGVLEHFRDPHTAMVESKA